MGKKKEPIYVLPNNIKVIGESYSGTYVHCYIEARPDLFPNSKVSKYNRQTIQRGRVVLTSLLGRPLARNEHVHHKKDKKNDHLDNLEILWAGEHNKHHKLGSKHSEETKRQIGMSLTRAYQEGRHQIPDYSKRPRSLETGRFV